MLLGKGIPWQNFLHLCEKFWFLSNPKEDAESSLCLCFNPNGSEYLLAHSVGYYRFDMEKEWGPDQILPEFQSFKIVGHGPCGSQKDVAILQTVLITKNPLVQIYYVSLKALTEETKCTLMEQTAFVVIKQLQLFGLRSLTSLQKAVLNLGRTGQEWR